jgi:hypothetical protein
MSTRVPKPGIRNFLVALAAGCGGFIVLWAVEKILVAVGMAPKETYLDELLVGIMAALLALALEMHHQAETRRIRQAAQLIGQLNHYIRNSLQVILSCSTMQPSPASAEAIRGSVRRIEWVLDKIVKESELFSGTEAYLAGAAASELDLMGLLQIQPEDKPDGATNRSLPVGPAGRSEQNKQDRES